MVQKYLKKRPKTQRTAMVTYARTQRAPATPGSTSIGRGISFNRTGNMFCTKRMVTLTRLAASSSVDVSQSYQFVLSSLPGYTDFTDLFDEYKIDKVKITWMPDTQQSLENAGIGGTTCFTALDFDDSATVLLSGLQQYETCQLHNALRPFTRTVVPRFAVGAYSGAFTSYKNTSGWIDVASTSVIHYGIKVCLPQQSGSPNTYTPVMEMWVSFRHTR